MQHFLELAELLTLSLTVVGLLSLQQSWEHTLKGVHTLGVH